jgi:hypothetical protein
MKTQLRLHALPLGLATSIFVAVDAEPARADLDFTASFRFTRLR